MSSFFSGWFGFCKSNEAVKAEKNTEILKKEMRFNHNINDD